MNYTEEPNENHTHRWMYLQLKSAYEPVALKGTDEKLYRFTEYAIMVCNGCTTVMKQRVKSRKEVDDADSSK